MELRLHDDGRRLAMDPTAHGHHRLRVDGVGPGARYSFVLDGAERPDPASRSQPDGVHGASAVVPAEFHWTARGWSGRRLREYVIYELHVGAFTPEGTFDGVARRLPYLRELGVTAVEILPVAQFPGARNWGYDGVYPYAAQASYGGPEALKRLVDAAHREGLAMVLDVVMNHLGPEGNYLRDFGPYFTDRYRTPWGEAINFDGEGSDAVRAFWLGCALQWLDEFRFDALRLDALDKIVDPTARPFHAELAAAVDALADARGRRIHAIAESDANDARYVRRRAAGGHGLHAQWADDLHHAVQAYLTGERSGYYADFGGLAQVARALEQPFVYAGAYSEHRGRRHGNDPAGVPSERFVVCSQNHDQVGNRMLGERLSALVDGAQLRLAAGIVLLSPYTPLLFMGEEYGETAPFQYFVDHGDPDLIGAVRSGRAQEFAAFAWEGEPPDPAAEETYRRSCLDLDLRVQPHHAELHAFYRALIDLRSSLRALTDGALHDAGLVRDEDAQTIAVHRRGAGDAVLAYNLGAAPARVRIAAPAGVWRPRLQSSDAAFGGAGATLPDRVECQGQLELPLAEHSLAVLELEREAA